METHSATYRIEQAGASRAALAGLSLAALMSSLATSIANVALPTLTQSFTATVGQVQWVVLGYLLATTTVVVSAGRLGDIVGRRRLLLIGITLFTLASFACGIAPTLTWLIAARFAQGLGAAIMVALSLAFISEIARERTGSAIGLLGTMNAVGTALGPTVGGALLATSSWRSLFFLNIPLGLAALFLVYRSLPADPAAERESFKSFDSIGTLLLGITLAAYALAMTVGHGKFGRTNMVLLSSALIGGAAFVLSQTKVRAPLLRLSMFRDVALRTRLLTTVLISAVVMTTLVVGPFYLSGALGLEPAMVGITMSVGPVVAALVSAPAGKLVDQFGFDRVVIAGLSGVLVGSTMLAVLPQSVGVLGYVLPLSVMTAGYATFQTANNTALMRDVKSAERGVISGLLNLARNLGLISGAALMGAIFAHATSSNNANVAANDAVAGIPAVALSDSVAVGMRMSFGAAAVLVLIALTLAITGKWLTRRRLPVVAHGNG